MEKNFSIQGYVQFKRKVWHESDSWKLYPHQRFPALVLPKKYYSWQGFKDAIEAFGGVKEKALFSFEIKVHEEKLTKRSITASFAVQFVFSDDLVKFLKLKHHTYNTRWPGANAYHEPYRKLSIDVPYTQPVVRKTLIVFPSGDAYAGNVWIEIKAHARYIMPTDDYTLEQLKKNYNKLMFDHVHSVRLVYYFDYVETDDFMN